MKEFLIPSCPDGSCTFELNEAQRQLLSKYEVEIGKGPVDANLLMDWMIDVVSFDDLERLKQLDTPASGR